MKKITFLIAFSMLVLGLKAQVFITELADPDNNANVRYIELYNAGSSDVNFTENSGWRIDKYTNTSATVNQTLNLTGTIPAGRFYIIATGIDDGEFLSVYGVSADQFDGADNDVAGSNGDDNLELYDGNGVLIDQFGVPGEDGTNTPHEFEDGRAERADTVTVGKQVWNVLEWNIDNDAPAGDGPQNAPTGFDPRAWIGAGTPTPAITWNNGTFTEDASNDGSFPSAAPIVVDIANETFAVTGVNMTENTHYSVTNLPTGLTVEILSATGTSANIILIGNAASHTNADDIANLGITFLDAAFTGGNASLVANASKLDITIDFIDAAVAPELTWSTTTFNEAVANDGSIQTVVTVNLSSDFFVSTGALAEGVDFNATNIPSGLTIVVNTVSNTSAEISFAGAATSHDDANDVSDITISFLDPAFVGGNASAVTNASMSNVAIDFLDPYVIPDLVISEIMYNSPETGTDTLEFIEIYNNGSDPVQLENYYLLGVSYTFPNLILSAGEYFVVAYSATAMFNTFGVTVNQWTSGGLSNSGEAVAIYTPTGILVDSVNVVSGVWPSSAGGGHSVVLCDYSADNANLSAWLVSTNYVTDNTAGSSIYASPMQQDQVCTSSAELVWSSNIFNESAADDGSIDNTISITLNGNDAFATIGTLQEGTDYNVTNLPTGLIIDITTTSATTATVALNSNAYLHSDADDVSNMEITFTDDAFVSDFAEHVTNYSVNNIVVDFIESAEMSMTWNEDIFNESVANDGSIANIISASLSNETFVTQGTLTEGVDYAVSNLPAGLSLSVETTSGTDVQFSFTGIATDHEAANSISNLSIEFYNAAFTGSDAASVLNSSNHAIEIHFLDAYIIPDLVFTEIMYNSPESGTDTIEFIEIYNNGIDDIQLENFYMLGVSYTFPNSILAAGEYLVLAYNADAMLNTFGVTASQWTSGGLSNGGEAIAIYNATGMLIDSVNIINTVWPNTAGGGHSLVLCDYTVDNTQLSAWLVSTNYVTDNVAGSAIFASPGELDPVCSSSPELSWNNTTFIENSANNGSISNSILLTLTEDAFSFVGTLVEGTEYTVANVPEGLTVEITSTSATEATITLNGNAINHNPIDDVSNMEIIFTDDAFASDFAAHIINAGRSDIIVDFDDFVNVVSLKTNTVAIYPNPTKGRFMVNGENVQLIEVTDITGKLIISSSDNTKTFDLSDAKPGMYFVKVYQNNTSATFKLVVE